MFCKKGVLKNIVKLTEKSCFGVFVIAKETPSQVFSRQFWEIFKSTFFIEHPQWLLLPILKPLDSHRQLCKRISELVTIYFISTFLVLVGIFVFNLASTSFPFTFRRPCAWRNVTFFIFHVTTQFKCHVTFWMGLPPHSALYHVLAARRLVNVEIKCFWLDTWPRDRGAIGEVSPS